MLFDYFFFFFFFFFLFLSYHLRVVGRYREMAGGGAKRDHEARKESEIKQVDQHIGLPFTPSSSFCN